MANSLKPTRKKIIRTASLSWSLYAFLGGQLKFLNQYYEMMTIGSYNKEVEPLVEKEGIKSVYIPIERTISPIKDVVSVYRLYKTFKREKPFLIHSMTPKAGLVSMLAAYLARVPKRAHSFTGLIFPTKTGIMRKVLITTDWLICRFATHIFPEGQGVKKDLEQHNVTKKSLKVIANGSIRGLDLTHFNPKLFSMEDNLQLRMDYGLLPEDFVFVYVGRLVNDKGINELVIAFNRLSQNYPEAKLLLIGSDEGESDRLRNQHGIL
ncbi:glycosyltransferase [Maribacter litopenaei]|uniref:Glycosyltransferase n=1 Tax=Maribacter litopenaei TaxID=2976127 RepID=A0ABY5YAM9_9FLAO|nr:glycosyltransferase [Maribacter litopenaei]UWX56097.1 glycosyltransferase [Maribacter litopenaei]